jgi:hypothetical protein
MRGRVPAGGVAAAVWLAICMSAAPAAQAGPRPGERYDGFSGTGQRIFLSVRPDGTRLHRYALVVRTRCSDGKRRPQGLLHRGERPVRIDAAGSFSHRSPAYRGGYGRVRGRLRFSFSGTFDAPGDTVSGEIRANFRSRRFDCSSGPVPFTLHRDGTAGAPWRDALMATGIYSARGRGVRARLRTLAPGRELLRGAISYRARCRSGGSLGSGRIFLNYPIGESGRVNAPGRALFRIPQDRVSVRARFRLTLRFSAGTQVSGVWRLRATVRRGGRVLDRCRMRSAFAGSFQSGPA